MIRSEYTANEALAQQRAPKWTAPAPVRANRKPAKRGFFARMLGL